MTSATGRSRTAGSRKARSMSESSSSVPLTSFAASGGSLLTLTTTCETPSERISPHAARAGLVRRDEHEVGDRAVLAREHVARARAVAADEAEVHHPVVVEDLRQVAAAGVGEQHDDDRLGTELPADDERGVHRGAARPADEQALLAGDPARRVERLARR